MKISSPALLMLAAFSTGFAPSMSLFARGGTCPRDPDIKSHPKLFGKARLRFKKENGEKTPDFRVETATSPEARTHGLMYRKKMGSLEGMIFDFHSSQPLSFWMHNTCLPLDMIFIGENRKVAGVVTAPPLNDEPRSVPGDHRWVVELNAGAAKKYGITEGAELLLNLPLASP
jgi:uncharacterized membrane protein (UPF0127 family)